MEYLQPILDQIPIRHDISSYIIMIGIVLQTFLCVVIFVRKHTNPAIPFLGWSLLFQALVFLDIYLCYTGLMKYVIWANDSTEPLSLLIAPMFYLFIYGLLTRNRITFSKLWGHLIIPFAYALTQIHYYLTPIEVKLNAYLGAYHNDIPFIGTPRFSTFIYPAVKSWIHYLILGSFLFYGFFIGILLWKERNRLKSVPGNTTSNKYLFTLKSIIILFVLTIIIFVIFYSYDNDAGDHYIGILNALIAFMTVYLILIESRFFEKSWVADKYETLGLGRSTLHFHDIEKYVSDELYFLSNKASLKGLAECLNSNSNRVSQIINSQTGLNFNDYINKKRIQIAQKRLVDTAYAHLTIEAIGLSVGFKSKSAFYNAFKKHTGNSPTSFSKQQ